MGPNAVRGSSKGFYKVFSRLRAHTLCCFHTKSFFELCQTEKIFESDRKHWYHSDGVSPMIIVTYHLQEDKNIMCKNKLFRNQSFEHAEVF